jgi:prolycopene isomerase
MAGSWNGMGGFQPTYMVGESTARAILKKIKNKTKQSEVPNQEMTNA